MLLGTVLGDHDIWQEAKVTTDDSNVILACRNWQLKDASTRFHDIAVLLYWYGQVLLG